MAERKDRALRWLEVAANIGIVCGLILVSVQIAQEREINTFFRLDSASVIARLQEQFPAIGDQPDPRSVFLKLRELRNSW